MSELYRHSQPGRVIVGIMLPIVILMFGILVWSLSTGESDIISTIVLLSVSVLLLVLMWLFSSLTIVVTTGYFGFWMGPGMARKRIPFTSIVSVEPVKVSAITGYGIRYQPGLTVYRVSGGGAVEVRYRKAKGGSVTRLQVGTDDLDPLMSAIRLAMHGRNRKRKG